MSSVTTGSNAVVDGYFGLAIVLVCVSWQSVGKRRQKYFLENVSVHMSESLDLLVTLEQNQNKCEREEDGMKIAI